MKYFCMHEVKFLTSLIQYDLNSGTTLRSHQNFVHNLRNGHWSMFDILFIKICLVLIQLEVNWL